MADKKPISPFACGPRDNECVGQTNFDTDYKSIEIVDKVVKTGEGEHDYIIEKEVIVSYKPIKEVIDADADSVGVYNIIKQVMRTGDTSLLPADDGKCNVDMVGAPENLMELDQMGKEAAAKFGQLPDDLTNGQDMAKFVESISQEQFDKFIQAVQDRLNKKEGNVNE